MDRSKIEQSAANQELIRLIDPYLDPESSISELESKAKANEIVNGYRRYLKSNPGDSEMEALKAGILECKESICSRIERKLHEHYPEVVATLPANPEVKNPVVASRQEQSKEQRERYKKGLEKYRPEAKLFASRISHFVIRQVDDSEKEFITFFFNVMLLVQASENKVIRGISSLG